MNNGLSPVPGGRTPLEPGATNEPPASDSEAGTKDGSGRYEAVFHLTFDQAERNGWPRSNAGVPREEDATFAGAKLEEQSTGFEPEKALDAPVIPVEGLEARTIPPTSREGGRIFIEQAGIAGVAAGVPEIERSGNANTPGSPSVSGVGAIGTATAWYPYQVMNTDHEESFSGEPKVRPDVKADDGRPATAGSVTVPASVAASAADAPANVEAPRAPTPVGSVAKAVEIVQYLGERLRLEGRDRATVRLVFEDGKSLTVRLTVADDTVRTTFRVDSSSLQQALQMHWSQVSHQAEERGLRFAAPVFESATGDARDGSHHSDERAHSGDDLSDDRTAAVDERRREDSSRPARQSGAGGWRAWA